MVKLSSLGDVVHTLPAAMDMHERMAGVTIDWVIEPAFAPLLKLCPAVSRIIPCAMRQWRRQWWTRETRQAWQAFRTELQAEAYDAIIDVQGLSKSALVSRMARLKDKGLRFAMANRTEGSGYEAPTRWVADVLINCPWHSHAVNRARHVCAQAMAYVPCDHAHNSLRCTAHSAVLPRTVALVHGSSRVDKAWPLAHWQEVAQALQAQGFHIALPHVNDAELLLAQAVADVCEDAVVWPLCDLVELSQRLAACAGVIGVDSGVSHIAVALGLPHVQIYNTDTAWRTGPVGCAWQHSVFALPTPSASSVLSAWDGCLSAASLRTH